MPGWSSRDEWLWRWSQWICVLIAVVSLPLAVAAFPALTKPPEFSLSMIISEVVLWGTPVLFVVSLVTAIVMRSRRKRWQVSDPQLWKRV